MEFRRFLEWRGFISFRVAMIACCSAGDFKVQKVFFQEYNWTNRALLSYTEARDETLSFNYPSGFDVVLLLHHQQSGR